MLSLLSGLVKLEGLAIFLVSTSHQALLAFQGLKSVFTVHIEACHGGHGGAFMQKDAQRNDRILAYDNRTLHMPERNFSSSRNGLSGSILCFEHNVDETYLQDFPLYQTLKDWKVGTLERQFVILLKLP